MSLVSKLCNTNEIVFNMSQSMSFANLYIFIIVNLFEFIYSWNAGKN
jgi:NADH:ubiquinone oxidoreductase subunit 3 (subunit A)